MRSCLIFLLLGLHSHPLFSQLKFSSRNFPANRKSIPIQIINNDPGHFFLLRYNRDVHDLIVEKRAKPSAEIVRISPLRMDSVNASWFNYQDLDHLFFEKGNRVFLFFEKRLNNERTLYLKWVDSSGRTGPFLKIASLSRDKVVNDVAFDFKLTSDQKILIVGTRFFVNGTVKKEVMLYDPLTHSNEWIKKLPIESSFTGYSESFECNADGDLFYFLSSPQVVSYRRKYMNHRQVELPVYYFDLIYLQAILKDGSARRLVLPVQDLWGLNTAAIFCRGDTVGVHLHYKASDSTGGMQVYLYSALVSNQLDRLFTSFSYSLSPPVEKKLTYFDGTDENRPADKDFTLLNSYCSGKFMYFFSGRMEENYAKEVFSYRIGVYDGVLEDQQLIPRKIYFYDDRSRFRNLSVTSHFTFGDRTYSFILENRQNKDQNASYPNFKKFARQRELRNGGLAIYFKSDGEPLRKKFISPDPEYDFIPLRYQGALQEYIMYQNRSRVEKFVILKLEEL